MSANGRRLGEFNSQVGNARSWIIHKACLFAYATDNIRMGYTSLLGAQVCSVMKVLLQS